MQFIAMSNPGHEIKSRFGKFVSGAILFACIGLSACASRPESGGNTIRTALPMEGVDPRAWNVLPPRKGPDDNVHSILALSGGGANGAFGAGLLVGWSERGDRPQFDVVTGVSTGALLSVFAFLGEDYDDEMTEAYTTVKENDILEFRGVFGLFTTGVASNKPLKMQIQRYVTDETLDKIAAEWDKGRRLYVATTNLDGGAPVIWDMGRIAKGGRTDRLTQFQKVLRASAAIPGVFDPVYIKPQRGVQLRQAHVDGGVRTPVLIKDFMYQTSKKRRETYLVVNGTFDQFDDQKPVNPNLISISAKSIAQLMTELSEETVYRDFVLARKAGSDFHMTAIPKDYKGVVNAIKFDPKTMIPLFERGRKVGRAGPNSWWNAPPRMSPIEARGDPCRNCDDPPPQKPLEADPDVVPGSTGEQMVQAN